MNFFIYFVYLILNLLYFFIFFLNILYLYLPFLFFIIILYSTFHLFFFTYSSPLLFLDLDLFKSSIFFYFNFFSLFSCFNIRCILTISLGSMHSFWHQIVFIGCFLEQNDLFAILKPLLYNWFI